MDIINKVKQELINLSPSTSVLLLLSLLHPLPCAFSLPRLTSNTAPGRRGPRAKPPVFHTYALHSGTRRDNLVSEQPILNGSGIEMANDTRIATLTEQVAQLMTSMMEMNTNLIASIAGVMNDMQGVQGHLVGRMTALEQRPVGDGLLSAPTRISNINNRAHHQANRYQAPRFHKLGYPTFDVKEDPLRWLQRRE